MDFANVNSLIPGFSTNLDYKVQTRTFNRTGHLIETIAYVYLNYSYHSIKRTVSIKRPGLDFFKKSLLNDQYDLKNKFLSS